MTIHAHVNQDNLNSIDQDLGEGSRTTFEALALGTRKSTDPFSIGNETAAEAVDQSQLTDTFGTNTNDAWQSFTPSVEGFLTAVELTFGGAITRTFEIYEGESNAGTVLLSMGSVAFISGTTKVTLATPVPLKAGRLYTAGIIGNGFPRLNNANDYAGGRSSVSALQDLVFQTFMVAADLSFIIDINGNIGMGGVPNSSAKLDIQSTTGAFMLPRMTTGQRDALTDANSMIIYNTTTNAFNFRENGVWVSGSGLA